MLSSVRLLGFCCLFTLTSFLKASDRERRISELERQMMEIGVYQKNHTFGAVYGPAKAPGSSGEIFVDLLFFKTQQTSSLLQTYIQSPEGNAEGAMSAYLEPVHFDWSPGVRVGYRKDNFVEDASLGLEYTYFSSEASREKKKSAPSFFSGLTSFFQPQILAHADYKVLYQNLDVDILKSYFISQKILWLVFAGLKSCYLLQKEKTQYELGFKSYQGLQFQSEQTDRCRFTGIGPKIGFLSRWYVFKEFSLFNKTATSLVYGYYLLKSSYSSQETSQDLKGRVNNKVKLKGGFHSLTPYGETTIGASWNRTFLKEKIQMTCSLAYQGIFFWRESKTLKGVGVLTQNTPYPTIKTINYSKKAEDISFNGIVLEIELDF